MGRMWKGRGGDSQLGRARTEPEMALGCELGLPAPFPGC